MQYLRQIYGERHGPDGEKQGAEAEGDDAEEADAGLAARRIHQRAAGSWLAIAVNVPRLRAKPMAVSVQPWVVR